MRAAVTAQDLANATLDYHKQQLFGQLASSGTQLPGMQGVLSMGPNIPLAIGMV